MKSAYQPLPVHVPRASLYRAMVTHAVIRGSGTASGISINYLLPYWHDL